MKSSIEIRLAPSGTQFEVNLTSRGTNARWVKVPANEAGLEVLIRILRDRAERKTLKEVTIGTESAPNVHLISDWLKEHKPRTKEDVELDALGLDLDSIDLEIEK